jgi:hypothetical protein
MDELARATAERDLCRAAQIDGNGHNYLNGWGALIGELDWEAEMHLIREEIEE